MDKYRRDVVVLLFWGLLVVSSMNYAPLAEAKRPEENNPKGKNETVTVVGKVVCQDCTKSYKEWKQGSHPLQGVKVGLTCLGNKKKVVYYASDDTNVNGEFAIPISGTGDAQGKFKVSDCLVRILSSPDPICNVPTNFGGGKTGVHLKRPSSIFRGTVEYTAGPFYFTSLICEHHQAKKK